MKFIAVILTLSFSVSIFAADACKLKKSIPYPAKLDPKKSECQAWNKQNNGCFERVCVSDEGSMYCEQSADKKIMSAISCN